MHVLVVQSWIRVSSGGHLCGGYAFSRGALDRSFARSTERVRPEQSSDEPGGDRDGRGLLLPSVLGVEGQLIASVRTWTVHLSWPNWVRICWSRARACGEVRLSCHHSAFHLDESSSSEERTGLWIIQEDRIGVRRPRCLDGLCRRSALPVH